MKDLIKDMEKNTHGGKRKGAGRKKGEHTTTISTRIKFADKDELKKIIADWKLQKGY